MSNSKPIRVAQIMGKLWAGGVENVVFNYYREIDKSKVQFDFYYDSDSTVVPPSELINMGARFIEIPPYQDLPIYISTLRKIFRENDYQIVHSHINTLSVFPLFAAWIEHVPIRIAHNHSVPGGGEIKRNLLKNFLRMFSRVFSTHYFACSEKAGRWLFGNRNYDDGNVIVIKNAIDFSKFIRKDSEITELKSQLGLKDKFVVGHVGRFTYAKNHEFLIDIFCEICKIRNDAVLILVGDGELHDKIVNKLETKKVKNRTLLVGQVTNPEKYYGLFDVVIVPSYFEGLSMTAIESQIAGVPIVISEAIPDEAIISNGYKYMKLTDSSRKWATEAVKISNKKVAVNNKAEEYNIKNKSSFLEEWYINNSNNK